MQGSLLPAPRHFAIRSIASGVLFDRSCFFTYDSIQWSPPDVVASLLPMVSCIGDQGVQWPPSPFFPLFYILAMSSFITKVALNLQKSLFVPRLGETVNVLMHVSNCIHISSGSIDWTISLHHRIAQRGLLMHMAIGRAWIWKVPWRFSLEHFDEWSETNHASVPEYYERKRCKKKKY